MQLSLQRAASWNVKSCRKTTYGSVQKQNVPKMKNRNVVFKSKISYRWSGTIRKRPKYAKIWNKLKKCTKTGFKTHNRADLARSRLTGSKLNRFLLFFLWTFLRWYRVLLHNRGREGTKKRILLCAKLSFSSTVSPFVCALIGKPSLFRWSALFMTQPQTCSLKAYTHTLYIFPTKTTKALLTPTLSPEWADKRRSSLTLAFPHKLKLNEPDLELSKK